MTGVGKKGVDKDEEILVDLHDTDLPAIHAHAATADTEATAAHVDAGTAATDTGLIKADLGDISGSTLGSLLAIVGDPAATSISDDVAATHAHAATADTEATAAHVDAGTAATDTGLLKADVGDASASTLTSIYGILGNPATTITAQIGVVDGLMGVPVADAATNLYVRDVVGIKTDAAVTATAVDKSLVAYAKGGLNLQLTPVADTANDVTTRDVVGRKTDTNAGTSLMALNRVPTADVVTDTNMRDVIGRKTDAAITAVGVTKSISAYVKGLVTMLTVPAADTANNAFEGDAVGNKTDAAVVVVAATKSIMAYVKGILNNTNKYWVYQTDAWYQGVAVQNTWYDILTAANGVNCRIKAIAYRMTTSAETIEVRVIVDGITIAMPGFAATTNTNYWVYMTSACGTAQAPALANSTTERVLSLNDLRGKSIQISIRKTTNVGGNNLQGRAQWEKWA